MNRLTHVRSYGLATLCVVLLTLLVDRFYFFDKDESRDNKEASSVELAEKSQQKNTKLQSQPKHIVNETNEAHKKNSASIESLPNKPKDTPTVKQLALVDVTLPLPPSAHSMKLSNKGEILKKLNYKDTSSLQANSAQAVLSPAALSPAALSSAQASAEQVNTRHISSAQITQRIEQLAGLKSNQRSLYFPPATTQKILEHMHTCIGIDVGAIVNNKLTVFSRKNSAHSSIVRVANGYQTQQERALLNIYAPGQRLVRLYPESFDVLLGKSISAHLGSAPLTSIEGQYTLRRNSLWLTNVIINQKEVVKDWQLSQGC